MEDNNEKKKQTWKTVTKTDMEDDNEIMDMEDNENDKKKRTWKTITKKWTWTILTTKRNGRK